MKNIKELRGIVAPRMRRCWGESCALFIISAGGFAAALFGWYLSTDFFRTTEIVEISLGSIDPEDIVSMLVALVLILLMWIIAAPYKYGSRWYRLQQVRGHAVHAKSVFSCYFSAKRSFQVYKLSAALAVRKLAVIVPFAFLVGAGGYTITMIDEKGQGLQYSIAIVLLLLLTAGAILASTLINLRYAAAPYLFAVGHDRPAGEIIRESERFMKGKHRYMAGLLRTMVLLLIPCLLIFPMFFLVPYVKMVYTAAINEIIEEGFEKDKIMDMER